MTFEADDVLVETSAAAGYACAEEAGYMVGLDTKLDPNLIREGLARELVRTVQEARKRAGLEVSDRITLRVTGSAGVGRALDLHRDYVMSETLAISWGSEDFSPKHRAEHRLDEDAWLIELAVAPRPEGPA